MLSRMAVGAYLATIVLVTSSLGIFYIYFGGFDPPVYDAVPIQKRVTVNLDCPPGRTAVSYDVSTNRRGGQIKVIISGDEPNRLFFSDGPEIAEYISPFSSCRSIDISTSYLDYKTPSFSRSAPLHSDDPKIATSIDFTERDLIEDGMENQNAYIRDKKLRVFAFNTQATGRTEQRFTFSIPISNILTRTGPDTWAVDLEISSRFKDTTFSDREDRYPMDGMLSVFIEPELVVDRIEPSLARTSHLAKLDIDFDAREELRLDPARDSLQDLLSVRYEEATVGLIESTRLQLTLKDPDYSRRRDIGLLVFSTLFGIAVTVLFETLLFISSRDLN